jgi:hypothetical protein
MKSKETHLSRSDAILGFNGLTVLVSNHVVELGTICVGARDERGGRHA